jgi:hypothetical protein
MTSAETSTRIRVTPGDGLVDGTDGASGVDLDVRRWLEDHAQPLTERWLAGVHLPEGAHHAGVRELVEAFLETLLELLPPAMGPLRESVEPLWVQTAELYGSLAAKRGLAAGEVIEEFQYLRESVIRLLWADPPAIGTDRVALREVLRLNRVLDRGTTASSVGHTDALFFALFQGSGIPEQLSDDMRYELREQLHDIRQELAEVVRASSTRG